MRLHNAAYVGDLDTLRNLLQEDSFKRWEGVIILKQLKENFHCYKMIHLISQGIGCWVQYVFP